MKLSQFNSVAFVLIFGVNACASFQFFNSLLLPPSLSYPCIDALSATLDCSTTLLEDNPIRYSSEFREACSGSCQKSFQQYLSTVYEKCKYPQDELYMQKYFRTKDLETAVYGLYLKNC
ncbi:hypothetical protein K7432_016394 [Basidiobolus ranarum]|uniref:Transmembrane protein n=1 Tax=Basidiobolus ranarum TaxID=34480 RepID=A0ABR2WEU8_9FUNG